jgi:hypothetical protein
MLTNARTVAHCEHPNHRSNVEKDCSRYKAREKVYLGQGKAHKPSASGGDQVIRDDV